MLGVNCRWSPIVLDERTPWRDGEQVEAYRVPGGLLRAGDRAPDAPSLVVLPSSLDDNASETSTATGSTTSLFQLFGPAHHTALVFSSRDSAVERAILRDLDSHNTLAPEQLVIPLLILPPSHSNHIDSSNQSLKTELESAVFKRVVDQDGYARKHYDIEQNGHNDHKDGHEHVWVVIVRPDGVVGAIVRGSEGIENYFSEL